MNSNVPVVEYVKIDKDLSVEKYGFKISNLKHEDTNEQFTIDDENDFTDCKVKDFSEALGYNEGHLK